MLTKNNCLPFSSLIVLLFLISCSNNSSVQQRSKPELIKLEKQKIIIEGSIDSLPELYFFSLISTFKSEEVIFDSLKFKFEFEKDSPILMKISNSKFQSIPIFAMPGDSVHLHFNFSDLSNDINSHKFTGSSIKENTVLSQLYNITALDRRTHRHLYKLEETAYLDKLDSIKDFGRKLIKEIDNNYFIEYSHVFLKYKLGKSLQKHHKWATSSAPADKKSTLNPTIKDRYDSLFEENPNWLNIYPYVEYLTDQFNSKVGFASDPSIKFGMIDSLYKNKVINDFCKYYVIKNELETAKLINRLSLDQQKDDDTPTIGSQSFSQIKDLDDAINFYKTTNPPLEMIKDIEADYKKIVH